MQVMNQYGEMVPQWGGKMTLGVVKENWDEKHPRMVKVEYFLGESGQNVSGWIPVMSPFAGDGYGMYFLPEIGSQVLIGFLMGDGSCPIVLGGLWSPKNKLPEGTENKDNSKKIMRTKGGSQVEISDEKGKETVTVTTPGGLFLELRDEPMTITLSDKEQKNQLVIDGKKGEILANAEKNLIFQIGGTEIFSIKKQDVTVKGGNVTVEASQNLKLKGQAVKEEAAGTMELKSSGTVKVQSSAILQVQGQMVKIN